jgi:hypothetical protein
VSRFEKIRIASTALGLFAIVLVTACQDTKPNSVIWTLNEVHADVGLLGGHQAVACTGCHGQAALKAIPGECEDCHLSEYDQVTNPNHREAGYPTRCVECHTSIAWRPTSFDHDAFDFSLEGAHAAVVCAGCHPATEPPGKLPTDCYSCHEPDYGSATPDHALLGLGTDCETCHTSVDWRSSFDHNDTAFPLIGAHVTTDCLLCHAVDGVALVDVPIDCYSCHEADYSSAEPNHVELAFGTACQDCHSSVDWRSDSFNHDATNFPLRGAHFDVDCLSCHADGFVNTPTQCVSCHANDEPKDHFGPDCAACHTDAAWTPSTFDHELLFPIQRGNHRKYENDCAACHLEMNDYSIFTCTNCHDGEHERNDMDDEHDDVNDYRYDSLACFECHPRGDEDDDKD